MSRSQPPTSARRPSHRPSHRVNATLITWGSVGLVIVVIAVLVIVRIAGGSGPTISSHQAVRPASPSLVRQLSTIPSSTFDTIGVDIPAEFAGDRPIVISGQPPLTLDGSAPTLLYYGAEYCPYCAAERWAMIVALSRFGTFSGLSTMHSSSTDVYANTPTWTFHGSTYTSQYLTFTPKEMYTDIPTSSGGYTTLDSLSSDQSAIFAKLDAPPYVQSTSDSESYPFVDFGNQYVIVGASYNPQTLDGLGWATIANDLSKPSSSVAKAVDGTANYMTAALCKLTNNQPATACTSTVTALQSKLQAPS